MDLVNRKVLHKIYGEGEIKKVNNKYNEIIIEMVQYERQFEKFDEPVSLVF